MPAVASIEELQAVSKVLQQLNAKYPEAYKEFANLFRKHRRVGYKNICKMLLGEATPDSLKEE